ncbi:guided entry of tail-anchored proteins factor 1 isoform X3 [Choloepus didactylus]|uniref:guided entry of tail-anchored proteins factor 1 isoform X3 n=1 Tax=Choloepus didactylus TaxID=27675 RepID=UPI00189FD8D4|nr:guided entry of tail-anchored proteins factor 1 isoform X3 [Choloepus didactylus]
MSAAEADRWAWLLVLSFVFGCNVLRILLPSFSSFMSRVLQKDAEQEAQMRAEIHGMKQELSTVNMMDEFARYARLERKINKMTDKLKTHVKARTAQLAKIKWVISVAFYVLQEQCCFFTNQSGIIKTSISKLRKHAIRLHNYRPAQQKGAAQACRRP